jgi:hypothetical protein
VNDPLVVAQRLPSLAVRAMRAAIVRASGRGWLTPRALIDDALMRFEASAARAFGGSVRPALLFAQRDRIVRELRGFVDGRLAARLCALRRNQLVATGASAAPFDLIVRNRRGRSYGILFREVPADGRRLEMLRRIHAAWKTARTPVDGVLVYDFAGARARLVLDETGAQRMHGYLRAS